MDRMEILVGTCGAIIGICWVGAISSMARPARHPKPKALPHASVTLNAGDTVTINGQAYTLTLTPTLSPASTPGPNPNPNPNPQPNPKPIVLGIRARSTGQLVTAAAPGTPLQIEGSGFGAAGGRIQLAGRIAAFPTSWTDTAIQFVAPDPGSTAVTGGWDIYQPSGNTFVIVASSGTFTLNPSVTPTPNPTPTPIPTPVPASAPLSITGFKDAFGAMTTRFAPGGTVFIEGHGFGSVPGTVEIGVNKQPVLSWTPTEIQIKCPSGQGPQMVTVYRAQERSDAGGGSYERMKGFEIAVPGGKR